MKKQLIITLIFLIVSVSVLGVASYAWYSNNISVQSSGMSVSVVMPINVMASSDPGTPAFVTSLEGFKTYFQFGASQILDGQTHISEYDMLLPVSSSDGINFAYLPFRCVAMDGYPKSNTKLTDYQLVREGYNLGHYIDIPLFITTSTTYDFDLYVSHINITDPQGEDPENPAVFRAVRFAVIRKDSGAYRTILVAKDEGAAPLVSPERTWYPMLSDGVGVTYAEGDTAYFESGYYTGEHEAGSPYYPSPNNKIPLYACENIGGVIRYYTTEVRLRIWVEGMDESAVISNEGNYFSVSVVLAAYEE